MVQRWSPENPQESDNNFSTAHTGIVVVDGSSSDDEADFSVNLSHYMPLAQAPTNADDSDSDSIHADDDDDDENIAETSSDINASNCCTGVPLSRDDIDDSQDKQDNVLDTGSIWALPREEPTIILNSEQVDQVKAAMANFILPSSSIPPWAATVPEEQWQEQLFNRIQSLGLQRESQSK